LGPPVQAWISILHEHLGPSTQRYRYSLTAYAVDLDVGMLKLCGSWRLTREEAEQDGPRLRSTFARAYRALWDEDPPWPNETPFPTS